MVLKDSEMRHAVNRAGRVCSDVRCCEGDFVFDAIWAFHVAEDGYAMHPFEDNEGAIQIATHPISISNSKHGDLRYHFLRELVERKEIEIIHVAWQYQHADFLTKALPEREVEVHRGIVMNLM